jgi:hypothetical protein
MKNNITNKLYKVYNNPQTIKNYNKLKNSIEDYFKILEYTIITATIYLLSVKLDSQLLRIFSYISMGYLVIFIFMLTEPYKYKPVIQIILYSAYIFYGYVIIDLVIKISNVI